MSAVLAICWTFTWEVRPAISDGGPTVRELGGRCVQLAARGGTQGEALIRDYIRTARRVLVSIQHAIRASHNKGQTARLKKRAALYKQAANLCQSLIGPCDEGNTLLEIAVENDSVVSVEFSLFGDHKSVAASADIRPATVATASLRYTSLANLGQDNVIIMKPRFNGSPIQDPNIKQELKYRFLTMYPVRQPCLKRVRIRLTNRDFAPKTGIIVPPDNELTTDNWYGYWRCQGPDNPRLNIVSTERIFGNYANTRWGAAHEDYTIVSRSKKAASGTYMYYDLNPAKSVLGRSGVWPGTFYITLAASTFSLKRVDTTSGWSGSYTCQRE